MTPRRTCALIPTLDGAATLAPVIAAVRDHLDYVLVIDDGSFDSTATVARAAGADVVRHSTNLGKGAALLSGFEAAAARGYTHCVTLDADGQHDPADIPALLAASERAPDALIIGARDFDTENVPGASKFGRNFSNFWVNLETGRELDDTQSGYRVYPLAHVRRLGVGPSRFQFEVEIIVRAAWAGLPVHEVPVSVYYPPEDERVSHYRSVFDSTLISLMHCRLVARWMTLPVWRPRRLL